MEPYPVTNANVFSLDLYDTSPVHCLGLDTYTVMGSIKSCMHGTKDLHMPTQTPSPRPPMLMAFVSLYDLQDKDKHVYFKAYVVFMLKEHSASQTPQEWIVKIMLIKTRSKIPLVVQGQHIISHTANCISIFYGLFLTSRSSPCQQWYHCLHSKIVFMT